MNYNYHTHTYRCRHASGTPEEYIQRAISKGIEYMGFSDHAPFVCTNGEESLYRVSTYESKDYVAELSALREKYAGKIDIKIGFEMEYYPKHFEKMLGFVKSCGAEYLILGEHFLEEENPDGVHASWAYQNEGYLTEYADCVIAAMNTRVFTYVAHPDIINFTGDEKLFDYHIRRICIAARETNTPLEINFLGIRGNRLYPNDAFWKIAGEEKSPVTFGLDAHTADTAFDSESIEKAERLVEKYNLNYIGRPEIRLIQEIK